MVVKLAASKNSHNNSRLHHSQNIASEQSAKLTSTCANSHQRHKLDGPTSARITHKKPDIIKMQSNNIYIVNLVFIWHVVALSAVLARLCAYSIVRFSSTSITRPSHERIFLADNIYKLASISYKKADNLQVARSKCRSAEWSALHIRS